MVFTRTTIFITIFCQIRLIVHFLNGLNFFVTLPHIKFDEFMEPQS